MKKKLEDVTLLGIDCIDLDRLIQSAEICQKDFEFADVKLLSSLPSNYTKVIQIDEIKSTEDYSRFIIEKLDDYVETSHVLVIQYDGFILNPEAWSDEYMKYDYIGAPWLVRNVFVNRFNFPKELLGKYVVGNGGFSLRSKKLTSLCSQLAKDNYFSKYHPEDAVICVYNREFMENKGIKFAPVELAKQFSYEAEDIENYSWNGQFGFHGLKWTDISKWIEKNPGYLIDNTLNRNKYS